MPRGPGAIQQRILLLLLGGVALSFSSSPRQYTKTLRAISAEWKALRNQSLQRAVQKLYQSQLITEHENRDGTTTLALSQAGRKRALTFHAEQMRIRKPNRWDGAWRIVVFDIPEEKRKEREAFRIHLRTIGMRELQKSVMIHPYPCEDEINFLIELHQLRPFVRQIMATSVDTDLHLRKQFRLTTG